MSDFEYASVLVSIVLALGIADILRFIGDTVSELDLSRICWVHFFWIIVLLSLHIEFWWRMWAYDNQLQIGPGLVLLLMGPAMLFVATRTLLHATGGMTNSKELFYRRKKAFFGFMILLSIWSSAFSPWSVVNQTGQSLVPLIGLNLGVIFLFTACFLSDNHKLQQGALGVVILLEFAEILSWPSIS